MFNLIFIISAATLAAIASAQAAPPGTSLITMVSVVDAFTGNQTDAQPLNSQISKVGYAGQEPWFELTPTTVITFTANTGDFMVTYNRAATLAEYASMLQSGGSHFLACTTGTGTPLFFNVTSLSKTYTINSTATYQCRINVKMMKPDGLSQKDLLSTVDEVTIADYVELNSRFRNITLNVSVWRPVSSPPTNKSTDKSTDKSKDYTWLYATLGALGAAAVIYYVVSQTSGSNTENDGEKTTDANEAAAVGSKIRYGALHI